MFELNKRYTLESPKGIISNRGIQLINEFIHKQRLDDESWKKKNPTNTRTYLPALPYDWIYEWLITAKGAYVGTFPKRVSKYYYQSYSLKCPDEFVQHIGNLARQHSEDTTVYRFDFVDKLDWNAGQFGDSGSCMWWHDRRGLETMEESGGMAIRFYNDDGDGCARAWLARVDNCLVIWGGYGFTLLQIARVLAKFTGLSYKSIHLDNHGTHNGVVWINGGNGYVIGQEDEIEHWYHYDLEWGDSYRCYRCGAGVDPEDCRYAPNDEMYCDSCFEDHCDYCHDCDETHWRDDMYYIESEYYDVCEYCYNRNYAHCDGCLDHFRSRAVTRIGTDAYCDSCLPDYTTHCLTCKQIMADCGCHRQPITEQSKGTLRVPFLLPCALMFY